MKKCDQYKDLILTDYIDRQLSQEVSSELENHLLDCSDCRIFLKEVKNNKTPFQQAFQEQVPGELWDTIKQKIENDNQVNDRIEDILGKLRGLIFFPRLVPVFVSFVLMLLAGSVTFNRIQIQQTQARDQGEYLVSLLSNTTSVSQAESNDLGTPIEHYFL